MGAPLSNVSEAPPLEDAVTPTESLGLTPASLKHVKRQRDALAEEKVRLQAELATLSAKLREQQDQVASLEADLRAAGLREAALQEEAKQARESESAERERANGIERLNEKLEESLARKEAELARMKEALEEQRQLTRDVCEAAAGRPGASDRELRELQLRVQKLQGEKEGLQSDLQRQAKEQEEMSHKVAIAMSAAEKAMSMYAVYSQRVSALRGAMLEEAMNSKVELHISVPKVTLTYNNAPPLHVSAAVALTEEKVRNFLEASVFTEFEPLWVSLDKIGSAPDGSSKKEYSNRMLDRLTMAIKSFIQRSQLGEAALADAAEGAGGGAARAEAAPATSRTSAAGPPGAIADADRARLLALLRTGDDRGLDAKLLELLEAGRGP